MRENVVYFTGSNSVM